jgi:phosphonate transport system permease protein
MSGQPDGLRAAFVAGREEVMARHAGQFQANWRLRGLRLAIVALVLGGFCFGVVRLGFTPHMLAHGFGRLAFISGLMLPPNPESWARALIFLNALGQTLAIALLGTLGAAALAFPMGFLAARNVVASRVLQLLTRRFFDCIRGVDTLIWALIWINVVGLGPFAGVMAIMTSDFAALGKLFSEAIEAVDRKAVDGVLAAGGSRAQAVRFGIIPQVLPVMASQMLYYFESNTRSATIIGIVGAGGIGLYLSEMIRTLEWQQVSFLILMLLVTVSIIDLISARLRMAIIGPRPA